MSHTLAPADVSHYYQRLAELSTLPSWQREEFTEPAGPERGRVWHWRDVYSELARSRQFASDASGLLPNDAAAIPAWTWHQLTASDRELVLIRLTDRPIHDAFGLFQTEEEA